MTSKRGNNIYRGRYSAPLDAAAPVGFLRPLGCAAFSLRVCVCVLGVVFFLLFLFLLPLLLLSVHPFRATSTAAFQRGFLVVRPQTCTGSKI